MVFLVPACWAVVVKAYHHFPFVPALDLPPYQVLLLVLPPALLAFPGQLIPVFAAAIVLVQIPALAQSLFPAVLLLDLMDNHPA